MKLTELLSGFDYESSADIEDIDITNVTQQPQEVDNSTLFVAIKHIRERSIEEIEMAKGRAAAIICEKDIRQNEFSVPVIRVECTRTVLPYLYARLFEIDFSKIRFIGVTGTNGKTSTATMIYHMLRKNGFKCGFIGTGRIEIDGVLITDALYSMTTPDPRELYSAIRQMAEGGCNACVMEVSSHALYFNKCLPIPFEIGIFTNLSPEHSDFHKSMEDYYQCKMRLFKNCKRAIFNMDDEYSRRGFGECECARHSVGIIWSADSEAREINFSKIDESSYIFRESSLLFRVNLSLGGIYNVYNSLQAIKAVLLMGVAPCNARKSLETLKSICGRMEIVNSKPCVIIDYAHSEMALENLLVSVKKTKPHRSRIILLFGCGGDRDKQKRAKMASVAQRYASITVITEDNSRTEKREEIFSDILSGFTDTKNVVLIADRDAAIDYAISAAKDDDVVIIAGKGHEMYRIDNNGYHPYDERTIIKESLKKYENRIAAQADTQRTV